MRRAVATFALVVVVSGCGSHPFAGMTRAEARRESIAAARSMTNVEALTNEFASPMTARPLVTFESRNSIGGKVWLTVFRLFKPQGKDPDQACIWAWRDDGQQRFEEVQSVAYGHVPDALHNRCVRFVFARGYASHDQVVGDEEPLPTIARPTPMTPFGPLARGTYPTEILPYDALFFVGPSLEAPAASAPGTCEFDGRVENEAQTKTVPHARVAVTPSRPWSGISDGGATAQPAGGVVTTADRSGSFVITDLPPAPEGYDISIRAIGYAPSRSVHQTCGVVGEWIVGKHPIFEDASPYPLVRR